MRSQRNSDHSPSEIQFLYPPTLTPRRRLENSAKIAANSIFVKSTGGLFPHSHSLELPKAIIEKPPAEGIQIATSEEYSLIFKHKHFVHFSRETLQAIGNGQEVVVKDNDKGRHSFTIYLPK